MQFSTPSLKLLTRSFPLANNLWSYYFIKGQQKSNPQGLIDNSSSESYAAQQFRFNQEVQEKIDNKTKNINTIIQRSF